MYLWEQGNYCELYRELWIDYDVKSQESKMLNQANCPQTFLEINLWPSLQIWSIKFICITLLAEVFLVSHLPIATPSPRNFQDIETKQLAQDDCAWTPSTPIKLIQGLNP